jgi:hypothetical protein
MKENDQTASLMSPARLARLKPQAPATPAAWLDQMAADVGRVPVLRLLELTEALKAQTADRDLRPVAAALQQLRNTLEAIDFTLLEPKGWLAKATGKARSAGAGFAQQVDAVASACDAVTKGVAAFKTANEALAADRTQVEMAVEGGGLDQIVEQGGRWLQDMRTQLQKRHAEAVEAVAQLQVREDAARCEILVTRLKLLREAGGGVQHTLKQAQDAAARRTAFLVVADQALFPAIKTWHGRMGPLATAAAAGTAALGAEGPKEAHRKLLDYLQRADNAFAQVQVHEQALAQGLDTQAGHLAAAEAA